MSENAKLTTPIGKHKIEVKAMVTGLDQEQIDAVYFSEAGLDELGMPAQQRANRRALELLVVSVDGSTENIAQQVLAMDVRDYQFVKNYLDELTQPPPDKKKLNSKKDI